MTNSLGDLQQQLQLDWQPPDLRTFSQALWDANGAAGCDSWSSQETKHMPLDAVRHLHKLTLRWYAAKKVPQQLTYGRQVTVPKTHKVAEGMLQAEHTRPITVLSIYWRAWASAWTRTTAMKQFAAHLPEEIAGVRGHAGCEEATTFLQHQFTTRKGVIITLDYSQCYDRLQVAVATLFLQQLGWPEALVAQLLQVWSTTRFLEFEQHVHPETLQGRGIPQGCPIAPICLSSVMTCGFRAVEALMINNFGYTIPESKAADTRIYMDDRTFVDSDLRRALDRVMAWTTWSSSVGLLENENKIQALAKTKALQSQLQILQPVWTQNKTLSALGVSIRAGPVANTALEEARVQAATQRAKLLACLPLSYRQNGALSDLRPTQSHIRLDQQVPSGSNCESLVQCSYQDEQHQQDGQSLYSCNYLRWQQPLPPGDWPTNVQTVGKNAKFPAMVSSGWLSCDSPEILWQPWEAGWRNLDGKNFLPGNGNGTTM